MTTPLLYELVNKLQKEEIRQLKKYIRSPFVTHREDLALMFFALADCIYKKKEFPTKEVLFQATFGERAIYDDQQLRSTMSDLHLIIEKYLKNLVAQDNEISSYLSLAAIYRQRNLLKHFQRIIRKVEKMQKQQPLRNTDYYQNFLLFQIENAQYQALINQRAGKLNLQEIGDTMDIRYMTQKLKHVCTQLSHQAVFQADYQFGLLKGWIDLLEGSDYLKVPAIALYYYCYRFLTDAYSQVYFRKFRQELSQNPHHFPQGELKDLYRAAINFCIRKLNEGSLEFTREGWELFQEGLETGIFLENDRLSRFTFDNVVGIGLRLKEFQAVEKFIKKYKEKLTEEYRHGTVSFNLARLEYARKNFDKALTYLHTSDPKDLVNQLISKTLLLKIYYESDEFNLLESHLDSFRLFIRRREVSDFHRQNFSKIIYYTRKLTALAPYNKAERKKIKKAIEMEKILTEKMWLLEKLRH